MARGIEYLHFLCAARFGLTRNQVDDKIVSLRRVVGLPVAASIVAERGFLGIGSLDMA